MPSENGERMENEMILEKDTERRGSCKRHRRNPLLLPRYFIFSFLFKIFLMCVLSNVHVHIFSKRFVQYFYFHNLLVSFSNVRSFSILSPFPDGISQLFSSFFPCHIFCPFLLTRKPLPSIIHRRKDHDFSSTEMELSAPPSVLFWHTCHCQQSLVSRASRKASLINTAGLQSQPSPLLFLHRRASKFGSNGDANY